MPTPTNLKVTVTPHPQGGGLLLCNPVSGAMKRPLEMAPSQGTKRRRGVTQQVSDRVTRTCVRGTWWYRTASSGVAATHAGPQEEALKYMEAEGHLVLAKWTAYAFGSFPTAEALAQYIEQTPAEHRQFYEVLLAEQPQRLFCEMDGLFSQLSRGATEASVIQDFYRLMETVFDQLDLGQLNTEHDRWLTSTQGDKLSLHWVHLGQQVFRNSQEQQAFWRYVRTVAEREFPNLLYVYQQQDGVMTPRCVLDDAVYTANRAMRTIYSSKERGSTRVLRPFTWDATASALRPAPQPITVKQYFIHAPTTDSFYDIKYPPPVRTPPRRLQREEVLHIIKTQVPDVMVASVQGRLFVLRNTGLRTCIINGERNETDNCFVVWRSDGLYFGCHDAGCVGQTKLIHSFLPPAAQAQAPAPNTTDYHFGDAIELIHRPNLEVEQFFRDCAVWVLHGGHPLVFVRNRGPGGESEWVLSSAKGPFAEQPMTLWLDNPAYDPSKVNSKQNQPRERTSLHEIWRDICSNSHKINLYTNVRFHPYFRPPPALHSTFNLFRGFPHQVDQERMNCQVLTPILEHLQKLCGGEQHVVDYVLKWQAHLIQHPLEKPGVALVFRSVQGAGKNLYWEFMKDVVGKRHWSMVARIDSVLGKFNKHMEGKLLTVLNEISNYGGAHKSNDYLKSLITDETLMIEPKGRETYTIRDCSRFVFLTNNNWAVKVESNDRRYVVVEADSQHVRDHEYFCRLAAALQHPDAASSMFSYLATMDLTDWNHRVLPQTQARADTQLASVEPPIRYVLSQLEEKKPWACFQSYQKWCESHNEQQEVTSRAFFQLLRTVLQQQPRSYRTVDGVVKGFDLQGVEAVLAALRAHLNQPDLALEALEEKVEEDEEQARKDVEQMMWESIPAGSSSCGKGTTMQGGDEGPST